MVEPVHLKHMKIVEYSFNIEFIRTIIRNLLLLRLFLLIDSGVKTSLGVLF